MHKDQFDPVMWSLITGIPHFDTVTSSSWTRAQKRQMEIPSHVVMGIQKELLHLGYYEVCFVDGIFGPRTHAALIRYQKDRQREIEKELKYILD